MDRGNDTLSGGKNEKCGEIIVAAVRAGVWRFWGVQGGGGIGNDRGNDDEGTPLRRPCGGGSFRSGIQSPTGAGTTENIRNLPRKRGGTPAGSHARRAAEVADIFIPLTRNENFGMTRRGLHSAALAGVDRSGRGCNPRPARGGLHSSAPAGVDRSGRGFNPRPAQGWGFNPRPAQEVRGAGVGLAPRRRK